MVAEEVIITLSGGAPWGFRLQGGFEHQKPLQVAKVRKRSKACRAGLREGDELISINDNSCGSLSHAQAMNLIDSMPGMLHIRVRRAPAGFQSVVLAARAPSPRIDKEYRAALRAMSPSSPGPHQSSVRQVHHASLMSSTGRSGLTSPPGSEAYYGETDSDADVAAHEKQRKQKRRSPSNSPNKTGRASPDGAETSEMSGYDSASDAQVYHFLGSNERGESLPGVARKEVIYQPKATLSGVWSSQTSTETSSMSADDQNPQEGLMEEEIEFQELSRVPLVSPERAKEALMLSSRAQMVPMVGPVDNPVDEELTLTYMDKAKQAKLNRGDTIMDKQVKEARSKCRTIASLLTDAPNPHSKGVLMFKKRRQRSKKYTLTSFGSVDEDMRQDSQEEVFPGSESEFDEEGFSSAPDPTWDSDYLEMLERRSASRGLEGESGGSLSPGLSNTSGKGAQLFEQQRRRTEEHAKKMEAAQEQLQSQMLESAVKETLALPPDPLTKPHVQPPPVAPKPARSLEMVNYEVQPAETQMNVCMPQAMPTFPAIINEDTSNTIVQASSMLSITNLSTPAETAMPLASAPLPELPASSVLNRTARPFAPGCITHRAATAPVVFRPAVSKKVPRPVSVAVVAPQFSTASEELVMSATPASFATQIAVNQMSADVPAEVKPTHPFIPGKPIPLSSTVVTSEPYSQPAHHVSSIENIQVASVPAPIVHTKEPTFSVETETTSSGHAIPIDTNVTFAAPVLHPVIPQVTAIPSQPLSTLTPSASVAPSSPVTPLSPVVYRDKTSATGGRSGILQEARRRSAYKPMFKMPDNKKNSPNPELLSMVQSLDERPRHGYYEPENAPQNIDDNRSRVPPPVAPKPRIIPEMSQIPQAEGKGAELFARRQSRMDLFVVDSPASLQQPLQHHQSQSVIDLIQPFESSPAPSHWKYSPNIRAPPPIGFNPLLSPSCPVGVQRGGTKMSEESSKGHKGSHGTHKEGIKALDFMRRQPYQLNSAMFSFSGGSNTQSSNPSYQRQQREGHTLLAPKQVPVKAARVYEIKRFSTPTPMSAPALNPTVIVPRSQTTLGEHLSHSDLSSPPPAPASPRPYEALPEPTSAPSRAQGLPELPKISSAPISHPIPYSPPAPMSSMSSLNYPGLQAAKQFKSAPELSALPLNPLKSPIQVPKPRFIATRVGIQPHVWRPGTLPH